MSVRARRSPALDVVDGGIEAVEIEAAYAADHWTAARLGVAARRGRGSATFVAISQPWLREAVKAWARRRLASGAAFGTVDGVAQTMTRFSRFLAACQPPAETPAALTRELLERYPAWLSQRGLALATRVHSLVFLRGFLDDNRRHRWVTGIPADAVLYRDDLPRHARPVPRFVPEFVMTQLESEANLARAHPTLRHLVVLITETGLRGGDACTLPAQPLVDDSVGWPCLRYYNSKMGAEQLVPLSSRAAAAIRAQQQHVVTSFPAGSPWLFPSRSDPHLPMAHRRFAEQFDVWQRRIELHDEAGRPVRVTGHQLRHTLGTRLINAGVPQHVIQRLLGHASPTMTAVYAQLHDATVREAFDRYCQARVDIAGRVLAFDPGAITAGAEWLKHNLSRVAATLPNGYCGRPPQQDCPHPNACLTCPDFQTTVEFLPVHRQQAEVTRALVDAADAAGRQRLAGNHRRVLESLERIIPALEDLEQPRESSG